MLMFGVVLTGAYTARLWFGIFHGVDGKATPYAAKHAGHLGAFDLPLLPLAVGAIGLGYLEAGTHGLSTLLGAAVVKAPEVHAAPTPLGLGAFALGLVGVAAGIWLAKRPEKGLPVPGGELSSSVQGELDGIPAGVASLHNGRVGRYVLITILGTALLAALAIRPTTAPLPLRTSVDGVGAPKEAAPQRSRDRANRKGRSGRAPAGANNTDDAKTPPGVRGRIPDKLREAIRDGKLKPVKRGGEK